MEDSAIGGEIGYMKGKESENHSFKIWKAQESLKIPNIAYKICRDKSGLRVWRIRGIKVRLHIRKGLVVWADTVEQKSSGISNNKLFFTVF